MSKRHEEHWHITRSRIESRDSYDISDNNDPPPSRDMEKSFSGFIYGRKDETT